MAEERPVRLCESCKKVDDHPRHVFVAAPGEGVTDPEVAEAALVEAAKSGKDLSVLLAQVRDDNLVEKHIDCCAADGCPDGSCDEILAQAGDKRGLTLAKALAPKED